MMENPINDYQAKAPGSIMLFGEHAVLRGHVAIVMAVEPYLEVFFRFRDDKKVIIHALGHSYETVLGSYETLASLSYVKASLELISTMKSSFSNRLEMGFELNVVSSIDSTMGLGSSSALIAALLRVLQKAYGWEASTNLLKLGLGVIHQVQKRGSGADLAASLYGGVIVYAIDRGVIERLEPLGGSLELIYSGSKKPTSEVLALLADREKRGELDLEAIEEMGKLSKLAVEAWKKEDISALGALSLAHGACMRRLGLYNEALLNIERLLLEELIACKISGSGLGDCMLAWGGYKKTMPYRHLGVKVAPLGSLSS